MAVTIQLDRGAATVIDDADAGLVAPYRWRLHPGGYAMAIVKRERKTRTIYLHRLIAATPAGMETDHINGDKLDNRRTNLRAVTRGQNEQNKRTPNLRSTTGLRGVCVSKKRKTPYQARVMVDGRIYRLGWFSTAEQAAVAAAEGRRRLMTHAPECLP